MNNLDGWHFVASRFASSLKELLFFVSDGRSNHHGYRGKAAAKDIRDIVRKYRKKGVEIIACAIGEDREIIRSIYDEGYLDVEDLATFPKSLVKLVRKRII